MAEDAVWQKAFVVCGLPSTREGLIARFQCKPQARPRNFAKQIGAKSVVNAESGERSDKGDIAQCFPNRYETGLMSSDKGMPYTSSDGVSVPAETSERTAAYLETSATVTVVPILFFYSMDVGEVHRMTNAPDGGANCVVCNRRDSISAFLLLEAVVEAGSARKRACPNQCKPLCRYRPRGASYLSSCTQSTMRWQTQLPGCQQLQHFSNCRSAHPFS